MNLKYRNISQYKYEVTYPYTHQLNFTLPKDISTPWFTADRSGLIKALPGYCWDGPSGPTFDTEDFIVASLPHDIGYQMLREYGLPKAYRKLFDKQLKNDCLQNGMSAFRARYVYFFVRTCAWWAAKPKRGH